MSDPSSHAKFERYGGSKVRSGCVTCKARRVKCDEAKPGCQRCLKARRQCGGYRVPGPKTHRDGQLVIVNYVAPTYNISALPGIEYREQRSLDFFRSRTALETFPTADWPEYLLRTCYYESAIRHALVALAALHEQFQTVKHKMPDSEFAMLHYSKAMRQVMKLDVTESGKSTDVAVLSCILFGAFESLQGHFRSALKHINAGLQILTEQEAAGVDSKVAYISKDVLRPMFVRFVTQSLEIGDNNCILAYSLGGSEEHPPPASGFSNVDEARRHMNLFLHRFMVFLGSLDSQPSNHIDQLVSIFEEHSALLEQYRRWCLAFDQLIARLPLHSRGGILILEIWRDIVEMMLDLNITMGELAWDQHIDRFRSIITKAEIFVNNQSNASPPSSPNLSLSEGLTTASTSHTQLQNPLADTVGLFHSAVDSWQSTSSYQPTFSLDLGVVAPLYLVCSRCRDPAIRRRALQLLASCNRKEGIWDSTLTARVAERLIAIEESGATTHPVLYASQLPEHVRVRTLNTRFGLDREGTITYTKSGREKTPGPQDIYQETLEW